MVDRCVNGLLAEKPVRLLAEPLGSIAHRILFLPYLLIPMIDVEHLSKTYGSTPAIQDVTFSVEKGEILGFLGPNGAGKTTTMRILTGYLPATSGSARIAGFDVHEDSLAVRQRIGYLPESPPLYPDMSVEGFLHFVARIKGVAAGDRRSRVDIALKRCNLLEKRKVLIRKLSKGFRQRVGIAQAIVHDPPAIILDEPTVGLDPRQIIEVRNLIKSLAGEHTIILSTHILPEVSMTCSRVAIINQGKVVAMNTPDQLMAELASGMGYELEVAGDLADVRSKLETIAGVKFVEAVPDAQLPAKHHRIRVGLEGGLPDLGRHIAAAVVEAGLGLYEMRRTQVSLEDVFLQLTMEEKHVEVVPPPVEAPEADNPGAGDGVTELEGRLPSAEAIVSSESTSAMAPDVTPDVDLDVNSDVAPDHDMINDFEYDNRDGAVQAEMTSIDSSNEFSNSTTETSWDTGSSTGSDPTSTTPEFRGE